MPRALAIHHVVVPLPEREQFRAHARLSRARCTEVGCRYWLYEESGLSGAYVEFFEAPDAATLDRARAAAPEAMYDPTRVYLEVELG